MGVTTIYLQGSLSPDGQRVVLPLSSCAVLLVVSYTQPSAFRLAFVQTDDPHTESHSGATCVSLPYAGLSSLDHEFLAQRSLPRLIVNVLLPAVQDCALSMVRSGLCVVVRHIVKVAHAVDPSQGLLQLLGFRQGSLRMCAEVSGWTKLCEVELPHSVASLLSQVNSLSAQPSAEHRQVTLPADLVKLEAHLEKPPKIHNDDRRRRSQLATLQADLADPEKCDDVVKNCRLDGPHFVLERMTPQHHGWSKFRVQKEVGGLGGSGGGDVSPMTDEEVCGLVHGLSYLDIHFVHLYSEGVEMTIADLCLFSYFYFLLECLQFEASVLTEHLPRVVTWLRHMVTLPRLQTASSCCAFDFPRLKHALLYSAPQGGKENISAEGGKCNSCTEGGKENGSAEGGKCNSCTKGGKGNNSAGGGNCNSCAEKRKENDSAEGGKWNSNTKGGSVNCIYFCKLSMDDVTEDDMELSRRCRTKHKALKPEVQEALNSMKERGIEPQLGSHPRGTAVSLDWDRLPPCVHPKEGEVPVKRVQRKCQQLENLVTAVMEVAHPGDVIVDFCSGGGHLGLAIAHLLPHCTVYLVENKEESLWRAQSRIADLPSNNVILYQCNMDYFVGRFDVGVCLHACGSATDMVLQQCLHNEAAFVICPCCYGGIQQTHLLTYPRSRLYQDKQVTYKEFLTLGHAADQTEFNIALEQQGRHCMNLVDSDRAQLACEAGYTVTLTSLQPLTCSPKNNLLIGHRRAAAAASS